MVYMNTSKMLREILITDSLTLNQGGEMKESYDDIVKAFGVRLRDQHPGSSEVAFPKEAAMAALNSLSVGHHAVIGGDVMKQGDNSALIYVYANWFCERH